MYASSNTYKVKDEMYSSLTSVDGSHEHSDEEEEEEEDPDAAPERGQGDRDPEEGELPEQDHVLVVGIFVHHVAG